MLNSEAQLMQHLGSLRHQEEIEEKVEEIDENILKSTVTISECVENTNSPEYS